MNPTDIVIGDGDVQWLILASENPDVAYDLDDFVRLTIFWPGGEIVSSSQFPGGKIDVDAASGLVTWTYSAAQLAKLPHGCVARYRLDRLKIVLGSLDPGIRNLVSGTVHVP